MSAVNIVLLEGKGVLHLLGIVFLMYYIRLWGGCEVLYVSGITTIYKLSLEVFLCVNYGEYFIISFCTLISS